MPKAGLEPARLAAPPPQDGVSANSTTSARSNSVLLLFGRRRRGRCVLLLLLPRWRLACRLLLLLLLLLLFCSFANDGGAARPQDQDRQRKRCNHEDDRCGRCGFAQNRGSAALTECGLTAAAAEGAGPIRSFTLFQKHDQNQKNANNYVKDR